jgi:hypothetical protein
VCGPASPQLTVVVALVLCVAAEHTLSVLGLRDRFFPTIVIGEECESSAAAEHACRVTWCRRVWPRGVSGRVTGGYGLRINAPVDLEAGSLRAGHSPDFQQACYGWLLWPWTLAIGSRPCQPKPGQSRSQLSIVCLRCPCLPQAHGPSPTRTPTSKVRVIMV